MRNNIKFTVSNVPKTDDTLLCDCCGEPLAGREVCRFDGSQIDSLYEGEHICKECARVLPEIDFLGAAYSLIRDYVYLQRRMQNVSR